MIDTRITKVHGRRVWDSRGRPTVEVDVTLKCGARGRAIAPAGASMGTGEAVDLRDGGARFSGFGVDRAIQSVNGKLATLLDGQDARDQAAIDQRMIARDGTQNRSELGGNALVATSMAVLHAAAAAANVPIWRYLAGDGPVRVPLPEIQIFGGGAHAARRVDIQDFMIMCPAASSFSEAIEWTAEVYRAAGEILKTRGKLQGVADEGGYWPVFTSNEEALDTLCEAIRATGLRAGKDIGISLDVAASEFGRNGQYRLALDERSLTTIELIDMLGGWIKNYPIFSVEDPVSEDDEKGFQLFTERYGQQCQIIGDDFLVTNTARIKKAAQQKSVTAVLIKPNQVGTITETREAVDAAKAAGLGTIVSARSGETEDVTIVHLSVGWNAGQLKVGSFSRSERMAKWNECLRIEEELGSAAVFAGWGGLRMFGPSPAVSNG
ncbi:MAG TPA: phosphopyruvate hydratase [Afipia sp.]